jgi:peptide/nickel transport system permease protein
LSVRTRIGLGLLALFVLLSAAYPLVARIPGLPDCPFGKDPNDPFVTVCEQAFGGLWRSVSLGIAAGLGACLIAVALALLGRRLSGVWDVAIEKAAELFFALPDVLVLLSIAFAVTAIRGGDSLSQATMVLSLIAIGWAAPTRMVQNRLRTLERMDFVQAAHAIGATRWRILTGHLLPFAWDYLLAIFLLRVPAVILTESTVSYLGFGLPPAQSSLGKYIGDHWRVAISGRWMAIIPAWVMLVLVVVAFQWAGKGLLERAEKSR